MEAVERDWKREINGDGVGYDGNSGLKGGTASGASAQRRTYPGHPIHFPTIPDNLTPTRTRLVVEAVSGKSNRSNALYIDCK